jgi:small subunit ribosomal protein S20
LSNKLSAEKYAKQSKKRFVRNRWYRTRARTFIKTTREQIAHGTPETAQDALQRACRALDMAAQKGVIHPNNAARRKSRLMKAFNAAAAAKG